MGVRLLAPLLALALLLAGSAAGDPGADKARIDAQIADLRAAAEQAGAQAGVLTEELSAVQGRVRELQSGVAAQQARLDVLEGELASARRRLRELDETIRVQTARLQKLRREHATAVGRLEQRVRDIYVSDDPDILSFVLGTSSFSDLLDNLELLSRIGEQDERIVQEVTAARDGVADARRRTRAARVEAAATESAVAARASEQQVVVARLVESRDRLVAAESAKRTTLASISENREHVLDEIEGLEAQSASLAATIRAAQDQASASQVAPPVGGNGLLSWPVSGPVTSGFGPRWGRMHEGIDIAVPEGTAVRAAAAGTVIYAGWLGGYGNLVVVDHGNGLSTAYAHNSGYASSVGQAVGAGDTIALSGNTGNSSGPHVHFEVRVNGSAVDPLGYL